MTRPLPHRRDVLAGALALVGTSLLAPFSVWAQTRLVPTPRQSEGPFYPREFPSDVDGDLLRFTGRSQPAAGTPTEIAGRILDIEGRPLAGAVVEIWQCDAQGVYHHVQGGGRGQRDENFQGFGRVQAAGDGSYRFRTIRPVAYPGRTPHIHFAVAAPGRSRFITQMYVEGEPRNESDGLLNSVRDPAARARLIVPLRPAGDGALAGAFDIVLA